jgi:membrane-bound ClpP family serine protease
MDLGKLETDMTREGLILLGFIWLGGVIFIIGSFRTPDSGIVQAAGIFTAIFGYPLYLFVRLVIFVVRKNKPKGTTASKAKDPTYEILHTVEEIARAKKKHQGGGG